MSIEKNEDYLQFKKEIYLIWKEIFPKITLDDNKTFGELGGHAEQADLLYEKVKSIMTGNYFISPTIAYDYPTVSSMSAYLWQCLKGIQLKTHIEKQQFYDEPIAIIGMSCRYPGHANNPDQFWTLLDNAEDAIEEVPSSRFDIEQFYDPDRRAPGKTVSRWGGFIDEVDLFDAYFFGISPKEAAQLDPQQRLLLELCWRALESAGISPKDLKDSLTGVYTGTMFHDYQDLLLKFHSEGEQTAYYSIGNAYSAIAGRIGYTLGLQGPCLAIDTACSSSLVAVHEACQHLKTGACNLAIAGGVNLILSPETTIAYSQAGMLSRDGHCKTFSADANGYVRSEGAGVIILKRLSQAIQANDPILAVISGSAINQNGASSGISAPSSSAQERLLKQALINAECQPDAIDYLEVHGTGTKIGDPIEFSAIRSVYGEQPRKKSLILGCVKTNIGHCESAAGIAGVIKVILSLQHERIPQNIHFTSLNPRINLDEVPISLALESIPWIKEANHIRRAAISSFGFSGINAHVIIEESPQRNSEAHAISPLTQFHRQHYWADLPRVEHKVSGFLGANTTSHPLWPIKETLSNGQRVLKGLLDIREQKYLSDHCVFDEVIFPAAGFIDAFLSFQFQFNLEQLSLEHILFEKPLKLLDKTIRTELLDKDTDKNITLTFSALSGEEWHVYATAQCVENAEITLSFPFFSDVREQFSITFDKEKFYCLLESAGLNYGPAFRKIKAIYGSNKESGKKRFLIELHSETEGLKDYTFYPPLLDAAFQVVASLMMPDDTVGSYLPSSLEVIHTRGNTHAVHYALIEVIEENDIQREADIFFLDQHGQSMVVLNNFVARKVQKAQFIRNINIDRMEYIFPQWQVLDITNNTPELFKQDNWIVWQTRYNRDFINKVNDSITHYSIFDEDNDTDLQSCVGIIYPIAPTTDALGLIQATMHFLQTLLFYQKKSGSTGDLPNVVFITQGLFKGEHVAAGSLMGFIKSVLQEYPSWSIRLVDTDDLSIISQLPDIDETFLAYYQSNFYSYRLVEHQKDSLLLPDSPYALSSQEGRLAIVSATNLTTLADDDVEVAISASGLNFRDVLNHLGLYPGDPGPLGIEAAGRVKRVGAGVTRFKPGDRVFGEVDGAFCSYTTTKQDLLIPIPSHYSDEEVAGLPIVFLTAYYSLIRCADLQAGDNVLIHAAAGGVGLAAIQIARHLGAEIYVTASETKQMYLKSLGITHCYNSRDTDFAQSILNDTQQQGVDVILNSLTSEGFIEASLSCLKSGGTFLEIGKRNIYTQEMMESVRPDVDYHIIAIDTLSKQSPARIAEMLDIFYNMLKNATFKPLPLTVFSLEEAPQAFHFLQHAKNIGKVVITQPIVFDEALSPNAIYLITGGLGALGELVTEFLLEHGAKQIMLVGRHAPTKQKRTKLDELESKYDANILTSASDISQKSAVKKLINDIKASNLKGIFHLAGQLDDRLLPEQTGESVERVFSSKAISAWYLHKCCKEAEIILDYFVLFSSIMSSIGGAGQSNYAAANSFLDQLSIYRRNQHLAAISINWGPWAESGMAHQLVEVHRRRGIIAFDNDAGKRALLNTLNQSAHVIQAAKIDWKRVCQDTTHPFSWLRSLVEVSHQPGNLIETLTNAPKEQRQAVLKAELIRLLQIILNLPEDHPIKERQGFFEMGMDSLLAVEFRNRLQAELGPKHTISNTLLFEQSHLEAVIKHLMRGCLAEFFDAPEPKELSLEERVKIFLSKNKFSKEE